MTCNDNENRFFHSIQNGTTLFDHANFFQILRHVLFSIDINIKKEGLLTDLCKIIYKSKSVFDG
jgi:hypothetical protein